MITLPDLPVDPKAFGDFISEKTFEFHYGKHHKGYVDNLNKLTKGTDYEDASLETMIKKSNFGSIYNNAAQVWNHTFFWNSLDATSSEDDISEDLMKKIEKSFKSLDEMKKEFVSKATTQFGSGWVWLTVDEGYLSVRTTANADTPLRNDHVPLLVCDLWEHAYYLDHQNDRAGFVEAFLKHANWKFASENAK